MTSKKTCVLYFKMFACHSRSDPTYYYKFQDDGIDHLDAEKINVCTSPDLERISSLAAAGNSLNKKISEGIQSPSDSKEEYHDFCLGVKNFVTHQITDVNEKEFFMLVWNDIKLREAMLPHLYRNALFIVSYDLIASL